MRIRRHSAAAMRAGSQMLGQAQKRVTSAGSEMIDQAQRRVSRAVKSNKSEDVFIKAFLGALGASLAVRLIRQTPLGAVVVRLAPIVAFVALYDQFAGSARSR